MVDALNVHQVTGNLLHHIDKMPESIEVKIAALRAAAETLAQAQAANTQLLMLANLMRPK